MKLRPLGDKVILQPLKEEKKTKTGIYLPDTVDKKKPAQAKVIAVGPGKTLENGQKSEMNVKKGNTVLFSEYSPSEVKVEDKAYLVIGIDDILAVVEE